MRWRSTPFRWAPVPVLVAGLIASCASEIAAPPRIATLVVVSGSGQTGAVGSLLGQPLVVRVQDQRGDPIEGGVVNWAVTSGTGVVSPLSDTTDADGLAQTTFRLGGSLGVQTVSATLVGLGPVSFTATAVAGPAAKLEIVAGNNQTGRAGQALPTALQIKVTDAFNNPKPSVPVSFTVISGGGSVSASSVASDPSGVARVFWILGPSLGPQSLLAGTGSLTPVTFSATATP